MTTRTVPPGSADPEITGVPDAEVPDDPTPGRAGTVVSMESLPVVAAETRPAAFAAVAERS